MSIKLKIEGKEVDCEVIQAPRGCFTEWEGLYDFPAFVIVGSADKPFDKDGYVLTFPIMEMDNHGMQMLHPQTVYTSLKHRSFIRMVAAFPKDIGIKSVDECVDLIVADMWEHQVPVHPYTRKYIKDKLYLKNPDIRKAWRLDEPGL